MKVRLQKEHTDGETARRRLEAARAIQTRFQAEVERLQNELGIEDQRLHSSRNTGGPAGVSGCSSRSSEFSLI